MKKRSKRSEALRAKVRQGVKEGAKRGSGSRFIGNINWWNPNDDSDVKAGNAVKMIILPYRITIPRQPEGVRGELAVRRFYWSHRSVGVEEKDMNCPKSIFKPCPICEEVKGLSGDYANNKEIITSIKAKNRELYNIVLYEDFKQFQAGEVKLKDIVKVFDTSWHTFGEELEKKIKRCELEEEADCYACFEGGKIVKVFFEEQKGGQYKFLKAVEFSFLKRPDIDEKKALAAVYDLDLLLNIPDRETIRKAHQEEGVAPPDDEKGLPEDTDSNQEDPEPDEELPEENPELDEELPEENPEPEGDELDEIEDRNELKRLIKKEKLDITVYKSWSDDDIREAIRDARPSEVEEDPEPEEETPKPNPKPKRSTAKSKAKKSSDDDESCPEGGTYGADCGEFDNCDSCTKWAACMDKKEELEG